MAILMLPSCLNVLSPLVKSQVMVPRHMEWLYTAFGILKWKSWKEAAKTPAAVGHHYVDHHLPLCQWVRRRRHFWDCVVDSALGVGLLLCVLMLIGLKKKTSHTVLMVNDGKCYVTCNDYI